MYHILLRRPCLVIIKKQENKIDQEILLENADFAIKVIKFKKVVAYQKKMFYTNKRCDMIAMKREVAAYPVEQVFRGANV